MPPREAPRRSGVARDEQGAKARLAAELEKLTAELVKLERSQAELEAQLLAEAKKGKVSDG